MNSPLGQYAQIVAAILAIFLIAIFAVATIFATPLHVDSASLGDLKVLAFLAAGVVFGGAAAVNGWKQPLTAAHTRLDTQSAQISALGAIVAESHPAATPLVADILSPTTPTPTA